MAAAMSDTPEIHRVIVQIRAPNTKPNDPGQVCEGRYIVSEGTLTLVHPKDGTPVRDATGKTYSRKLGPDDDARIIAGFLTKEFRLVLRGKTNSADGFSRPLSYPKTGMI